MLFKKYFANHETNAVTLAIVSLGMKDFAEQILRHVHQGGAYDDAAVGELQRLCIRNLKDTGIEGMRIEQETKALNEALRLLQEMMDDAIKRAHSSRPE